MIDFVNILATVRSFSLGRAKLFEIPKKLGFFKIVKVFCIKRSSCERCEFLL